MISNLTHKILYPAAIIGTVATVMFAQIPIANSISPYEIGAIAKKITVKIEGAGSPGSGVIIAKQGNTYFVLTAGHVIKDTNPGEEANITTHDGKEHSIDTKKMIIFPDVDLALLQFNTQDNYQIAEIGESDNLQELSTVYVAGYPIPGAAIGNRFTINDGKISSVNFGNEGGYDLIYNNPTITGMSGGPVLNEEGKLIAIHGQAETKKGGFNLGIPIKIFLANAPDRGINIQKKKNTLDLQIASNPSSNQGNTSQGNLSGSNTKEPTSPPPTTQSPPSPSSNTTTTTPPQGNTSTQSPPSQGGLGGIQLITAAPNANKELMYQCLEQYLAAGDFRKADEQTWELMKQAGNGGKEYYLTYDQVENFSCSDLRKMDQLWVKYSSGKFGFSVQRRIWESVGGNPDAELETWRRFAIAVGWKTEESGIESGEGYVSYKDHLGGFTDVVSRVGNLPRRGGDVTLTLTGVVIWKRLTGYGGCFDCRRSWTVTWTRRRSIVRWEGLRDCLWVSFLALQTVTCNI